jgi:hypothetical protein
MTSTASSAPCVETLHAEDVAAFARDAREPVNSVAVAEHFERFAQHDERFALRVVDPALGRPAHVDHDHDRQVALAAVTAGEDERRELGAVAQIHACIDERVEIDAVAFRPGTNPRCTCSCRATGARHRRKF